MGNQSSKDAGASKSGNGPEEGLQSYPSFGKSETRDSSRSFRSLRSRIPGRTDSPRSSAILSAGNGDSESGSRLAKSPVGRLSRNNSYTASSPSSPTSVDSAAVSPTSEDPPPPQSPVSTSVKEGQHQDIAAAQASGEVDHVSDQPPSGATNTTLSAQQPSQSILVKREDSANWPNPAAVSEAMKEDNAAGVAMSDIKDIDVDDFIKRLLDAAYTGKVTKSVCLKNAEITAICHRAREVFLSQPALLELDAPVKIVGDVHGQYTDLIRMFEMCGFPPHANFLFLGDYVDRGKQSLETILLLLCYKLKYPENFFLLRGNHECANVTRVYGFYDECKRRCNVKIWKTFIDTFNTLPIAAIVASKIFCVHGGLSPALSHMDDIRNIARPTDVPDYGLLNDLLWSDPADMEQDWEANERGVSYCFGKKVITDFLAANDFDLVCRAHMVVEDGYEFFTDRVLVTVFSAPNVSSLHG